MEIYFLDEVHHVSSMTKGCRTGNLGVFLLVGQWKSVHVYSSEDVLLVFMSQRMWSKVSNHAFIDQSC